MNIELIKQNLKNISYPLTIYDDKKFLSSSPIARLVSSTPMIVPTMDFITLVMELGVSLSDLSFVADEILTEAVESDDYIPF